MRKKTILIAICFIILSQISQAQVTKSNFIRVDPIRFLSALAVNVGYEYSISPTVSIGAEGMFNSRNRKWVGKNNIGAFARFYFDNESGISTEGVFCEAFSRVSNWDVTKKDPNGINYSKNITDTSLGFGAGYKYMLNSGLGIDLSGGLGRFLFAGENKLDWKLQLGLGWAF